MATPLDFKNKEKLEAWCKYEDIAMHFNDLLMRLRTQALAGIAAISTLVGIFSKENILEVQSSWLVAGFIFVGMGAFWIAIGILDIFYYNRLLLGAVAALSNLEKGRDGPNGPDTLDMSTTIALAFVGTCSQRESANIHRSPSPGIIWFYAIVFFVIGGGAYFSFWMHNNPQERAAAKPAVVSCEQVQISSTKGKAVFSCIAAKTK
jgi:hypothetical protein